MPSRREPPSGPRTVSFIRSRIRRPPGVAPRGGFSRFWPLDRAWLRPSLVTGGGRPAVEPSSPTHPAPPAVIRAAGPALEELLKPCRRRGAPLLGALNSTTL